MALASTSVLVVERAPKNGCCQYLCLWWESQWPSAFSGRLLQDKQVSLTQATFKALCWHRVPKGVRFCM